LLITLLLYERGILARPLLYLSLYLKRNQLEYYDRLQAVRERGDWEGWVSFFLTGVRISADEATDTTRKILRLREDERELLSKEGRATGNLLRALDHLFQQPITTPALLASALGIKYATANNVITRLVELEILKEQTGYRRNRRFAYYKYMNLFEEQTEGAGQLAGRTPGTIESTVSGQGARAEIGSGEVFEPGAGE
jgi:Fic family protein